MDYDHCELLGDTLTEIATEKSGIMKKNVRCFTVASQTKESLIAMRTKAEQVENCELKISRGLDKFRYCSNNSNNNNIAIGDTIKLGLGGNHQYVNASLAVELVSEFFYTVSAHTATTTTHKSAHEQRLELFEDQDPIRKSDAYNYSQLLRGLKSNNNINNNNNDNTIAPILPDVVVRGLERAEWPGRCQIVKLQNSNNDNKNDNTLNMYLDGAHTTESIKACANWFEEINNNNESVYRILIFHCMSKRDPIQLLTPLAELHRRNISNDNNDKINTDKSSSDFFEKIIFVPRKLKVLQS